MKCGTVEFNSHTVVYGGWTPEELHQFSPHTDVLAPVQGALEIDGSVVVRPRLSMMQATFETLRCFWDPHPPAPSSGAAVLRDCFTCCVQCSRKSRKSLQGRLDEVACVQGLWLRFVSSFPHRKYTVERTPRQLEILLGALRVSFPYLLIPACCGVSVHAARGLLDFVKSHAEAVAAYLPLLYFLYEMDERSVVNFFDTLEELVRRRRESNECNLLTSRRPRESSWFRWGAPKPVPQEDPFSVEVLFMETHAARLPDAFKAKFLFARSRKEALGLAGRAAVHLRDALLEDVEAFETAVEFFATSSGRLLKQGCAGWAPDSLQEQHETTSAHAAEDERIKRAIAECMSVASVLQGQVFGPIVNSLVDALRASEFHLETQFCYLQSLLQCAKAVVQNEPLITGAKAAPKSRQTAQSSMLLSQASERYGRMRQTFRAFKLHVEEELALSENAIRRSLVLCCTHCLHAFTIFYDAFDARHHMRLIPSDEKRDASVHPLLQVFGTVREEQRAQE
ncbi:uncharacterized protein Tco025E_04080 [Trypanosoma conorhini]|uniref:Uncharacterized protein n=1 Tax=Trypanosoma conorhini TaxID=83891 RepID=A0A422PPE0_9TRYP|nr:uncharacterized protein Tco025E_04080 [Trypanosoma conorhini]RNF19572.1 hypothetical protein Tco025E_04080 [Trypanosoma conorhini]